MIAREREAWRLTDVDNTTLLSRWVVAQSSFWRWLHQVRKIIVYCLPLAFASLLAFSSVPSCALSSEAVTGVWSWRDRGVR